MKKSFLTLAVATAMLAAGLATPALAQNSAVTNAILSQKAGQLDKALVSINEAITNEKTKDKAKTWFTRGDIYYQIVDPSTQALFAKYGKDLQPGEALQKATESYNKALQLDGPAGEFGKQVPARLQNLYGIAFNAGVVGYQAKEYDKALTGFRQASQINPQDTTAILYSAYTQDAKQDFAGAKASYTQLLSLDAYKSKPAPVAVYQRLLQIAREEKNDADAQKVLSQALVAYPNNKTFLIEDLNRSMAGNNGGAAAVDKITKTIAADPTNANLYAVRGSLYDQQKKTDLAQADYKKAIELDPKNFDAEYNMGIYNFNQAAALYTKASKMDLKTYQLKGKALETDGKKYFEASVPYFEKALEVQPNDPGCLSALQKVYFRLGRNADSKKMEDRLQALKK
ncbi:tetratricopeptide repeat protein [Hymenobacter sp. BRD67]|uniref:tetratricopeptide repeat protein n=1 Tax=Hymenobacter sp. BRD67 TaxID=2675877 RepID=UPI00156453C8|nr:tetratricopeptide repeat protein [Hymenobacter sp. BRD67]QKG52512.1 tetratricopeptide repeat protein [Hymenobacter sp. BRD67]